MKSKVFKIKIQNPTFGVLMNENFADGTQFKIFLKLVHNCLELKTNLDFFNGTDFLVHIPYKVLSSSVIITNSQEVTATDIVKSKIEALVTK
jgi:hypothetical protein